MFIETSGPIEANTTYCDNKLVAKDVEFSLPEISAVTADIEAMGTMSLPLWSRLEDLEYTITKIGVDMGLAALIEPKQKTLEHRWAQTQIAPDGNTKTVGCKAFLRGIPTTIPAIEVTNGEALELEVTYTVTRYQLFFDGKEILLVDRLTGDLRINGKDYSSGVKNLL